MIIEYPLQFFFAFFVLTITLGAWLGYQLSSWRIRRLQARLDMLKIEVAILAPRRSEIR